MKRRTRFRGDLQVDGDIVGSDGQPIDFGGGGSVDLAHLTELSFGAESDARLSWADVGTLQLDSGQGETAYLYATNESELYADDLQEAWFYPGAVDLADYRYDNLVRLRTSDDIDHGLYVGKPGQRVIYGPDGMRFNPSGSSVATSLLNTAPGTLEIDHTLSFKGSDSDVHSGISLAWDQDDYYGLVLTGPPGAGDAELYLVNPDDGNQYSNVFPAALDLHAGQGTSHRLFAYASWSLGPFLKFDNDTTFRRRSAGLMEIQENGGGYVAHSPDGTAYKLTPPNGGGAATWVAA